MNSFLHILNEWDTSLLLAINGFHNLFFDEVFFWITSRGLWVPFYVGLMYLVFLKHKKSFWFILVAITILITLTDQSSVLIKNLVERQRPCYALGNLIHLVHNSCGGQFGFVSSHASNSFGLAMFISLLLKKNWITITMFCWATLLIYSRAYMGVHYPSDLLAGAALGTGIGSLVFYLFNKFRHGKIKNTEST